MDEHTREEIGDLLRRLVDTAVEMKDRIEALEAQLAERDKACVEWSEVSQRNYQRAKAAEQALATARADALRESASDQVIAGIWAQYGNLSASKAAILALLDHPAPAPTPTDAECLRNAKVRALVIDCAASLAAAISLLERGGKKGAASDKMFEQMLKDYKASLDRARTALADIQEVKE
jgi:hypothetical protein